MQKGCAGLHVEEQRQPPGSVFLRTMDGQFLPRRHQRNAQNRLVDRSLPNTPFSLYPDEPGRTQLVPPGGRRHIKTHDNGNPFYPLTHREVSPVRRAIPRQACSHLDSAMQQTHGEETPVRFMRQRCRTPPFENCAAERPRQRMVSPSPLKRGHLQMGSLVPVEEPLKKERVPPPPMVKKQLCSGRRHTPLPRSMRVEDRRIGVKMVPPPPHWTTAEERRARRFDHYTDGCKPHDVLHRNHSSWNIGFVSPGPATKSDTGVSEGSVERGMVAPKRSVQRGKSRSATPQRRNYDIISGTPL